MQNQEIKAAIQSVCHEVSPSSRKVDYTIPVQAVEKELEKIAKDFVSYAQVPGFRKGKAPVALVKKRFKPQIEEEFLKNSFYIAIDKTRDESAFEIVGFKPVNGNPVIEAGKDLAFSLEFDIVPDFKLPDYKNLKLDSQTEEITEEKFKERLDYFKNLYAVYKPLEEAAKPGDMLKVSYTSDFQLADDAPAALKNQVASEENWFWLNEPEQIPGLIVSMTGAEKGKEYTFDAVYAADYREAALAGKTVKYTVKVQEVQRRMPAETDAELCERMKVENTEKLHADIKENLKKELEIKNKEALKKECVDKICASVEQFPLPPSLLSEETQRELRNVAMRIVKSEADAEEFKKNKETHLEEARKTAETKSRQYFIMRKIARLEKIAVSESEVDQEMANYSRYYGVKEKEMRKMMEQSGSLADLEIELLMNKVAEFLVLEAGNK